MQNHASRLLSKSRFTRKKLLFHISRGKKRADHESRKYPLPPSVLRSTVIFLFSYHLSNILPPTQLLSWCFSLELFAQFHPVARCLNPSFDYRKKLKIWDLIHFKIKSPNVKRSLQSYTVSKCRLIHKIRANSSIETVS